MAENDSPGDESVQMLKKRIWGSVNIDTLTAIHESEKSARVAAVNAAREIQDAADAAATQARENALAIADARAKAVREIDDLTRMQINKIEQLALDRLAAFSLPPPDLEPVDLDPEYSPKDIATAPIDSLMWVALECRRIMVRHGLGYRVDYSRASKKPPTALAMWMAEYYVKYPEKLDRLFMRLTKPFGAAANTDNKLAQGGNQPKSPGEIEAEEYMRSIGMMPTNEDDDEADENTPTAI